MELPLLPSAKLATKFKWRESDSEELDKPVYSGVRKLSDNNIQTILSPSTQKSICDIVMSAQQTFLLIRCIAFFSVLHKQNKNRAFTHLMANTISARGIRRHCTLLPCLSIALALTDAIDWLSAAVLCSSP